MQRLEPHQLSQEAMQDPDTRAALGTATASTSAVECEDSLPLAFFNAFSTLFKTSAAPA